MSHIDEVFLHVPGAGGTALGAEAAVQAYVLVLDHYTFGGEGTRYINILAQNKAQIPPIMKRPCNPNLAVTMISTV